MEKGFALIHLIIYTASTSIRIQFGFVLNSQPFFQTSPAKKKTRRKIDERCAEFSSLLSSIRFTLTQLLAAGSTRATIDFGRSCQRKGGQTFPTSDLPFKSGGLCRTMKINNIGNAIKGGKEFKSCRKFSLLFMEI